LRGAQGQAQLVESGRHDQKEGDANKGGERERDKAFSWGANSLGGPASVYAEKGSLEKRSAAERRLRGGTESRTARAVQGLLRHPPTQVDGTTGKSNLPSEKRLQSKGGDRGDIITVKAGNT